MKEEVYHQLAEVESVHWWFRHRAAVVRDALRSCVPSQKLERVLDVGCGPGSNFSVLREIAQSIEGADISDTALQLARQKYPRGTFRKADANEIGRVYVGQQFSMVSFFNVLYHRWIRDDEAVIRQAAGLLRPGGLLLITDAAFPSLFRPHDDAVFGARRYLKADLAAKLERSGLKVVRSSYFTVLPFFPAYLAKFLPSNDSEVSDLQVPSSVVSKLVDVVMVLERAWLRLGLPVPFGVSVLCIAEKQ